MNFSDFYSEKKQQLSQASLHRELCQGFGLDFCSNDYLGLANSADLRGQVLKRLQTLPLGSTGSRLLRGHSNFCEELESELAAFSGQDSSLFFPSGYQANLGLFSTLLKENATVFSDELIHASIIDGVRLSGCEKYIWSHNDLNDLEMLVRQKAKDYKLNFVVVESIYSMRGDFAPLKELSELCDKYNLYLIVDEAHATGLFGETGSGLVEASGLSERVFATIHTAGKALGVSGAWIAGGKDLKAWLVNAARPFIYSTAPSFYQQAALSESLRYFKQNKEALQTECFGKLNQVQKFLSEECSKREIPIMGLGGPVTAVILKDNEKALEMMESLKDEGIDIRAIRPPSVPDNQAMLRITIPGDRTLEEIGLFKKAFLKALGKLS